MGLAFTVVNQRWILHGPSETCALFITSLIAFFFESQGSEHVLYAGLTTWFFTWHSYEVEEKQQGYRRWHPPAEGVGSITEQTKRQH